MPYLRALSLLRRCCLAGVSHFGAVPQAFHACTALCNVPTEPAGRHGGKLAEEKPTSSCQPVSGAPHRQDEGWGCQRGFSGTLPKYLIWKRWEVLAAQLRSAHWFDAHRATKSSHSDPKEGCFQPLKVSC